MVEYGDTLLSIGGLTYDGENNSIYSLTCSDGNPGPLIENCSWSKLNQELSVGRSAMVAMIIPDLITSCSN